MENEFKANVTYIANKLREDGYIEGDATSVNQGKHEAAFKLKYLTIDSDFLFSLEETLYEAHEWTGKEYQWYIFYMHTLEALEITITIV